jgi:hypothetical protein
MSRRHYFTALASLAMIVMLAIPILLSACGSSATAEPSPIPPTSTLVPPTPTSTPTPPVMPTAQDTGIAPTRIGPVPTQQLFPPQQQAFEDTLVYIKQKYGADLALTEIGFAPVRGQEYVTLIIKVKCMSGDCASGTLYQWIIISIAPFEKVPENLAVFHIQVHGQQDELLEDVQGRWVDLMDMHDNKISMEELLGRLVFIR